MKKYDKLIRDKIPEIIEKAGKKCNVQKLGDKEYKIYLDKKLQEELNEYYESGEVEELADIVELIYAHLDLKEVGHESFEQLRLDKRAKRGGFEKRLKLVSVDDN